MRTSIKDAKRIVVKVGTSTLTHENGKINFARLDKLSEVLSDLANEGKEIILVSSGAIGIGAAKMKWTHRPVTVVERQAAAAVGQSELMHLYSKFFGEYGHVVAQILLTSDVFEKPVLRKNVQNSFAKLLSQGIVPIVNENDPVATDEIEGEKSIGDNDTLSALVAKNVHADLLILLSDIDGFYTDNPKVNPDAVLIDHVSDLTEDLLNNAKGSISSLGTGGMSTKLKAAQIVMTEGINMIIAHGENPSILYAITKGELIGTWFKGKRNE